MSQDNEGCRRYIMKVITSKTMHSGRIGSQRGERMLRDSINRGTIQVAKGGFLVGVDSSRRNNWGGVKGIGQEKRNLIGRPNV